jgi:RNA polymerase sigma factor (sigma-70 family)
MTTNYEVRAALRAPDTADCDRAADIARRVARHRLGGVAREGIDVDDVVQEVLLRFARLDLDEVDNWEAWVVTVTRNRCSDLLAAARRHQNTPIDPDPSRADEQPDADIRIATRVIGPSAAGMIGLLAAQITQVLSERERAVLMAHVDGWTNAEIAERFGYARAQSVAVIVSRAKRRVREQFATAAQRDDLINPQRVY